MARAGVALAALLLFVGVAPLHGWRAARAGARPRPPRATRLRAVETETCNEVTCFTDLVERLIASEDPVWELMQFESRAMDAMDEDTKAMHDDILTAPRKEDVIIRRIVRDLETPFLSATQLQIIFQDVAQATPELRDYLALDVLATALCADMHLVEGLDVSKGLHALLTFRFYSVLHQIGKKELARFLHSQNSEVFMADIHPAAKIGYSFFIGTASGVVIGETAVVGNGVTMAHFVTLGGNGKDTGDRHSKVADGVFLGAGAQIIGNIPIGEGAVVSAKSVVVKPVPPFARVAGVPAKVAAIYACEPILEEMMNLCPEENRIFYTHQPML
mmetsp:Transcript_19420/g.58700  ORF Transcript_19420/g.58700 Transcript_19420/m.58700 type:complete len:331 (-) Transcript_19420:61-1053(-)